MTSTSRVDTRELAAPRQPRRAIVGRLYVAEYSTPPTHADLTSIADDVDALRVRIGGPIHYLGIVKASAEVPGTAHREAMALFGKRINATCETAHLVLEGDGFKNAIQRSVITAVHVLKRQNVACYRTELEAVSRVASLLANTQTDDLLRTIQAALQRGAA